MMDTQHAPAAKTLARDWRLRRDQQRRLVLTDAAGKEHVGVEPLRCFPISRAEQWISICDPEGHELLCIEEPDALTADLRQMLEEELARREFVPEVTRILRISDDSEYAEWEIETDRGPTLIRFNTEDAVRRLNETRVLIIDASGIRFLISDTRTLDRTSRRLLDRYI
jgi:hypothetical protein